MEIKNINKLANQITANILEKIDNKSDCKVYEKSCLILIPNMSLGINEYFEYIAKYYPGYKLYLGLTEEHSKLTDVENNKNIDIIDYNLKNNKFIKVLDTVETIIILGLKINQMKALIKTDDSEDVNHLILGGLMENKFINSMMNANELIFNKITDVISDMRHMGIIVTNIHQSNVSSITSHRKQINECTLTPNNQPEKVYPIETIIEQVNVPVTITNHLITESQIMKLKNRGLKEIILDKKQLITPLAKDRLREYKIDIKYIEEAK